MNALRLASILALGVALGACGGSSGDTGPGTDDTGSGGTDSSPTTDSGARDTATTDTAATDSATTDSGVDAAKDSSTADSSADSSVDSSADSTTTDSTADTTIIGDSTTTDSTTDSSTTDTADGATAAAWWTACTASTTCAAPTGETGGCLTTFGQPVCGHTCNSQVAYSLCEGGAGMCVPITSGGTTTNVCLKKCGDKEAATCGAGAACAFLGYRDNALTDGGTEFDAVGTCVPDCSASGADACAGAATACDPARKSCDDVGCPSGCPSGSSCVSGSSYCQSSSPSALYADCDPTLTTANGCTSNLCVGGASGTTGGFCSVFCDSASASTQCGTGGVCWFETDVATTATADSGTIPYPEFSFSIVGGRSIGACLKGCGDSADCPSGFYCAESNGKRACVPGAIPEATTAGGAAPGEVCHVSTDCASGSCGLAPGYVDGICLKSSTGTCPTGTVAGAAANECDKICDPTADNSCAGSLVCIAGSGTSPSTCGIGICRENTDCASGYICDHATSTCKTTASTGGSPIGSACTSGTSCSGGACIAETTSPSAWAGGYCTSPCTVLPDLSDTCPTGTICSAGRMGLAGDCLKLCDTTAPFSVYGTCRAGYKCSPLGDPAVGFCVTL